MLSIPGTKIINAIREYHKNTGDYPTQAEVSRMIGHNRGYVHRCVQEELLPKKLITLHPERVMLEIEKPVIKLKINE